ncbi:MAG: alpha-glucosidase/alpha-galactosidase [Clostridia bacterium]|nr:alpha-glucosidase/alpha-galactosidase [Clostridia bacterium]
MIKLTFVGAGSTVFAKNVIGDCLVEPALHGMEVALFDIDPERLDDSYRMVCNLNEKYKAEAKITKTLDRAEALKGAKYVVNAIQVGGYDPCTITDFEIPKKYGLRQTIADTLGIGGIFRALRTIPVMLDICEDIKKYAHQDAIFINYTNPMAMLSGAMQRYTDVPTVGLCHSVQGCAGGLLNELGFGDIKDYRWKIAGINHQAWLLEIKDKDGNDLYPMIKERANDEEYIREHCKYDLVRLNIMKNLGYYVTESSEHNSEYMPYYIKDKYPELIEKFNIPLDEYPRRCINQIEGWKKMREELVNNKEIEHNKTGEFASYIINAMETDVPYRIHGNVLNTGLITNLPKEACVEVPCLVDRNGINPCYVGDLPEQCAAMNRTNINVQLLAIQAAITKKKDYIYQAAMMDPHTASELSIDHIKAMCDDLITAHGSWLPEYK